jgi:hypothetical protein
MEIRNQRLYVVIHIVKWTLLILEVVLSVVVLGITGSAASGFRNDLKCDVPNKLGYNIATVCTLIVVFRGEQTLN